MHMRQQGRRVTVAVMAVVGTAVGALASCQNQPVGPRDAGMNLGLGGGLGGPGGGAGGPSGDGGVGNSAGGGIGGGGIGGSIGGPGGFGFGGSGFGGSGAGGVGFGFGGFRGGPGGNGGPNLGCLAGAGGRLAIPGPQTASLLDPVEYVTGAGAYSVVVGDLNSDGRPDLLVGDYYVGARSMLNNGRAAFGSFIDHSPATGLKSLALGDLDGDGRADLAGVAPDGVSVLINQGDTSFGPPTTYAAGESPSAVVLADLNGDGWLDMAVANQALGGPFGSGSGVILVLLNTGSGTFYESTYPTTGRPSSIAAADLNGDCRPDLVIGDDGRWSTSGGLSVFLNRGDGSFPSVPSHAVQHLLDGLALCRERCPSGQFGQRRRLMRDRG